MRIFRIGLMTIFAAFMLSALAMVFSPQGWWLKSLTVETLKAWLRPVLGAWLRAPRQLQTPALDRLLAQKGLRKGDEVFLRIFKRENVLELWMRPRGATRFILLKSWPICAWSGSLGPKLKEGDGQSPEGFYSVGLSSLNPNSRYHLSFNLGFPNAYDRAHGRTGSFLMVHGACVSVGCYAMTDAGIEEIYALVEAALRNGQKRVPVHIFPFRMTAENMRRHANDRWIAFWRNLKEGHDLFEKTSMPPRVRVRAGRYVFAAGKAPPSKHATSSGDTR